MRPSTNQELQDQCGIRTSDWHPIQDSDECVSTHIDLGIIIKTQLNINGTGIEPALNSSSDNHHRYHGESQRRCQKHPLVAAAPDQRRGGPREGFRTTERCQQAVTLLMQQHFQCVAPQFGEVGLGKIQIIALGYRFANYRPSCTKQYHQWVAW